MDQTLEEIVRELLDLFPEDEAPQVTIYTADGGMEHGYVDDDMAAKIQELRECIEAIDNGAIEFELDPRPVRDDSEEDT